MGNVGNLLILADGIVVEHGDDFYRMQVGGAWARLRHYHRLQPLDVS